MTENGNTAPILLLAFNRPAMLRGLAGILSGAKPPRIYLAVDGPRPGRAGEAAKCAECAAMLDSMGWPCEVRKLVRGENLGCKRAVEEALDWFFSQEDEGIVLEDDCWPDLSFLRYATELLERYRNDQRVGIISGDNDYGFISDPVASYRFSAQAFIWGWATWARVWRAYRADARPLSAYSVNAVRRANVTSRGRALATKFAAGFAANPNTWDIPFALWLQANGNLNAIPRRHLVANRGNGNADGTHTQGYSYDEHLFGLAKSLDFPLIHPLSVERDLRADRLHELRSFAWLPRILTVAGLRGGRIGSAICAMARAIENALPGLFRV